MNWFDIIKIRFDRNMSPRAAAYSPPDDEIYLGPKFDFDSALRSIIHEETHRGQMMGGTQGDFRASISLGNLKALADKYEKDRENIEELISAANSFKDRYLREWLEESLVLEIQAYRTEAPNEPLRFGPINSVIDRLTGLERNAPKGIAISQDTDLEYDYNDIVDDIVSEGKQMAKELEERRKKRSMELEERKRRDS